MRGLYGKPGMMGMQPSSQQGGQAMGKPGYMQMMRNREDIPSPASAPMPGAAAPSVGSAAPISSAYNPYEARRDRFANRRASFGGTGDMPQMGMLWPKAGNNPRYQQMLDNRMAIIERLLANRDRFFSGFPSGQ